MTAKHGNKFIFFVFIFAALIIFEGFITPASAFDVPAAEELLASMTLRQKVGQLFVIRPDQLDMKLTFDEIQDPKAQGVKELTEGMKETLKRYPAGGFALFGKNIASPGQLKRFTKELSAACFIAPLMAVDEEGGRVARIANSGGFDVPRFESMQALGAGGSTGRVKEAASAIGAYIRKYGFNMDLAPVCDVNTNPENIVIGNRAFGSDPSLVSAMAGAYLDGLHEQGIAGSMKHFPGHGDTASDTHTGRVTTDKTWDELLHAELVPFIGNLDKADSVMAAHITLSKVTKDGLPASLSEELITGRLRNELGYGGVVITDALSMGAVREEHTSAEAAVLAFKAGCDILLMPWDYTGAFNGVLRAVYDGSISRARLDESVMRILKLKAGITAPTR